jgi:hypothetical protein
LRLKYGRYKPHAHIVELAHHISKSNQQNREEKLDRKMLLLLTCSVYSLFLPTFFTVRS